jgi:hypothetical protein
MPRVTTGDRASAADESKHAAEFPSFLHFFYQPYDAGTN